jgi:FMN reductase
MTRRLAVVSAGLGNPSSTRLLADRLSAAAAAALGALGEKVDVDVIELRPLAHALADSMLTGFASGELATAVEQVRRADALIAVTPVFSASYSGLFKSFFDVLDPESLTGTPVLVAATAGTARHSLVLDHALRPLFSYLRATIVPTGVFAATEDFGSTAAGPLDERIERAARSWPPWSRVRRERPAHSTATTGSRACRSRSCSAARDRPLGRDG